MPKGSDSGYFIDLLWITVYPMHISEQEKVISSVFFSLPCLLAEFVSFYLFCNPL